MPCAPQAVCSRQCRADVSPPYPYARSWRWRCVAPATTFAALGGSSAFSELTEGQTQTETTPTQTTATSATTETTNSNSSGVLLIAGGAALLLLGGIAFLIMRDARSVAPAGDGLWVREAPVTTRRR